MKEIPAKHKVVVDLDVLCVKWTGKFVESFPSFCQKIRVWQSHPSRQNKLVDRRAAGSYRSLLLLLTLCSLSMKHSRLLFRFNRVFYQKQAGWAVSESLLDEKGSKFWTLEESLRHCTSRHFFTLSTIQGKVIRPFRGKIKGRNNPSCSDL